MARADSPWSCVRPAVGRQLRDRVLSRDGTLVVRPDSGDPPAVVVEVGAGAAIATVRERSAELAAAGATLVRINPQEAEVAPGGIALEGRGEELLLALAQRV